MKVLFSFHFRSDERCAMESITELPDRTFEILRKANEIAEPLNFAEKEYFLGFNNKDSSAHCDFLTL